MNFRCTVCDRPGSVDDLHYVGKKAEPCNGRFLADGEDERAVLLAYKHATLFKSDKEMAVFICLLRARDK